MDRFEFDCMRVADLNRQISDIEKRKHEIIEYYKNLHGWDSFEFYEKYQSAMRCQEPAI